MKLWSRLTSTFRNLLRKPGVEKQLDDEVRAYVDMIADERIAAGISPSEARRTAQAESGGCGAGQTGGARSSRRDRP